MVCHVHRRSSLIAFSSNFYVIFFFFFAFVRLRAATFQLLQARVRMQTHTHTYIHTYVNEYRARVYQSLFNIRGITPEREEGCLLLTVAVRVPLFCRRACFFYAGTGIDGCVTCARIDG